MRQITLDRPAAAPSPRLARLTRHLAARLADFGPGGPQVDRADQEVGLVAARFPGHDVRLLSRGLERFGIRALPSGEQILFYPAPDTRFEELDYLWGCLFELL